MSHSRFRRLIACCSLCLSVALPQVANSAAGNIYICQSDEDGDGVGYGAYGGTFSSSPFQCAAGKTLIRGYCLSYPGMCTYQNEYDNCPSYSNVNQLNTDGDAQGNACDTDDDNDSVPDISDAFPLNASESVDTDNDGSGNNADTDDDGDGVLDVNDPYPLDPTRPNADADGDGVVDSSDNCPAVFNADQLDTDGDAQGDACDIDLDNDGVVNNIDNCPFVFNADQLNTDNDDEGNECDADDDNDGVLDHIDAAPLDASNTSEIILPVNSNYNGGSISEVQNLQ